MEKNNKKDFYYKICVMSTDDEKDIYYVYVKTKTKLDKDDMENLKYFAERGLISDAVINDWHYMCPCAQEEYMKNHAQ